MGNLVQARSAATDLEYLVKRGEERSAPSFVLLHGLTGDERVMWVLESSLPAAGLIVSPRGLFEAEDSGRSWLEQPLGLEAALEDFQPAVEVLDAWLEELSRTEAFEAQRAYLVGFSQGAALGFALAALGAIRPAGIVALAAFLPTGDFAALSSIPVYWGHGSRDDTVSPERARADIARLKRLGVEVRYCEADVGHKVGAECLRDLKDWMRERAA